MCVPVARQQSVLHANYCRAMRRSAHDDGSLALCLSCHAPDPAHAHAPLTCHDPAPLTDFCACSSTASSAPSLQRAHRNAMTMSPSPPSEESRRTSALAVANALSFLSVLSEPGPRFWFACWPLSVLSSGLSSTYT